MSDKSEFCEIVRSSLVCLNREERCGRDLIAGLLMEAAKAGLLEKGDLPKALRAVMNREASASTALPGGIALPHGRVRFSDRLICLIGIHQQGVDFQAPDGGLTHIFVVLLVPLTLGCMHIQFLAHLSKRLLEPSVCHDLLAATERDEVINSLLNQVEEGVE